MLRAFMSTVLAVMLLAGCSRDSPIDGVGEFRFGKTTLSDWGYQCHPPKNGKTFCQNNPLEKQHHLQMGGQNAYVGAVFLGDKPEAPLAEIELFVENCDSESLRMWMNKQFGEPLASTEEGAFWAQKVVFIAAELPTSGTECRVSFVKADDAERIAQLKKRA